MLKNEKVWASIPTTDIARAVEFYQGKLGLKLISQDENQAMLGAGGDTGLSIYIREPTKTEHTLASWKTDDLDTDMADLKAKGVSFEDYDMPMLKTENGVATWPNGGKAAWFKDPDGNTLGIFE